MIQHAVLLNLLHANNVKEEIQITVLFAKMITKLQVLLLVYLNVKYYVVLHVKKVVQKYAKFAKLDMYLTQKQDFAGQIVELNTAMNAK